jgi:hypothetical protein
MDIQKITEITVEVSTDGIADAEIGEERDQVRNYIESLTNEIKHEYPNAEVEVTESLDDRIECYTSDVDVWEEEIAMVSIEELMHDHLERWIERQAPVS